VVDDPQNVSPAPSTTAAATSTLRTGIPLLGIAVLHVGRQS
jgi:hypothetical protein